MAEVVITARTLPAPQTAWGDPSIEPWKHEQMITLTRHNRPPRLLEQRTTLYRDQFFRGKTTRADGKPLKRPVLSRVVIDIDPQVEIHRPGDII